MFTEGLAQFLCNTGFKDLTPEVVINAKNAVLDFVGVALSGSQEPSSKIVNELVKENEALPEATVLGGRFKASCALAALANGNSSHAQDFDDCLDYPTAGLAHPTTGIFPAVLALGEKYKMAGKDIITAYCVGVDAYGKTGLIVGERGAGGIGWEWTGVLGVIGAAAAVSKLLKLDREKTIMALGIAATMSCGLARSFGSMAGHIHAGNAARHGIEAGILAQKGYTATYHGIIEGPNGFYNAITGNRQPVPAEKQRKLIDSLGNPWSIADPGLMFKAYPLAHISHFGTYGGIQIRQKYSIDWRQIKEIEFRVPEVMKMIGNQNPQTGVQGKFSLVYCLCRALIHGEIDFSFFTDEAVKDPDTRQLMSKVRQVYLPESPLGPFGYQEIVLKLHDGSVYSYRVDHPKGEPQNPQTPEELAAKFRKCALSAGYGEDTISRVKDVVMDLENVTDISQLTSLLGHDT